MSGTPDWLNTPLTWPGREAKKAAAAAATGGSTGQTQAQPMSATTGDIWGVIDEEARDDPQLAQALKLAVQLESGGRADAVGDQGRVMATIESTSPPMGSASRPNSHAMPARPRATDCLSSVPPRRG